MTTRRDFIKSAAMGTAAVTMLGSQLPLMAAEAKKEFTLPALPYAYDALEPHIDKMTMEIHHSKHHQAYVTNLNKAVKENKIDASLDDIIRDAYQYPDAVRNNAGGHWNHTFFWSILSPQPMEPSTQMMSVIQNEYGSVEKMKSLFNDAAMKRFGSGWAWLFVRDGKLQITSTPNQDNILMKQPSLDGEDEKGKAYPILALDVWEHAYYLKYQNKRIDYVNAFWNIINWKQVDTNLMAAARGDNPKR